MKWAASVEWECGKCIGFALNYQLDNSSLYFARVLLYNFFFQFKCSALRRQGVRATLCIQQHNGHFTNGQELDFFFAQFYARRWEMQTQRTKSDVNVNVFATFFSWITNAGDSFSIHFAQNEINSFLDQEKSHCFLPHDKMKWLMSQDVHIPNNFCHGRFEAVIYVVLCQF